VVEQPLPGGFVTTVVRAGNTVRRAPPKDPEFVHALLGWFERSRWNGAPRFLGTDELGREILSFIDGHAAWEPGQPPSVTSDVSLARLAVLVREFHDLTAGTPLAAGGDLAMTRLRDSGGARSVRDAFDWVTSHRAELATHLR
jgi:hypothetical protein